MCRLSTEKFRRDYFCQFEPAEYKKETAGIEVIYQGGAAIFNAKAEFEGTYHKTMPFLQQKLEELAAWVKDNHGLIEHIEGNLQPAIATLTATGGKVLANKKSTSRFDLTCKIYMLDETKVCEKISEVLTAIAA